MTSATKHQNNNRSLQSIVDTIVVFGWALYPYVTVTRSLRDAMALVAFLSISTASEMAYVNRPAFESNLKRVQIHHLSSQLQVSYVWATFLLVATPYLVCRSDNPVLPNWIPTVPLFDASNIDFAQITFQDIFAFIGAAWFADVIFSYHHKYYLHKYHSSIHKLHHCCKALSIGNVLTFHPANAMMELSIMNFPTLFLYGNDNMVLFTLMWTYFNAFANHSVTYGTSHGKVHHGLTAPAYNCYPMVFTDFFAGQNYDDVLQNQLRDDGNDEKEK